MQSREAIIRNSVNKCNTFLRILQVSCRSIARRTGSPFAKNPEQEPLPHARMDTRSTGREPSESAGHRGVINSFSVDKRKCNKMEENQDNKPGANCNLFFNKYLKRIYPVNQRPDQPRSA